MTSSGGERENKVGHLSQLAGCTLGAGFRAQRKKVLTNEVLIKNVLISKLGLKAVLAACRKRRA